MNEYLQHSIAVAAFADPNAESESVQHGPSVPRHSIVGILVWSNCMLCMQAAKVRPLLQSGEHTSRSKHLLNHLIDDKYFNNYSHGRNKA